MNKTQIILISLLVHHAAHAQTIIVKELAARVQLIRAYRLTEKIKSPKLRARIQKYLEDSYRFTNDEEIPKKNDWEIEIGE